MGLDMYLYKIEHEAIPYLEHDLDEVKASDPALYAEMKPYIKLRGEPGFFQWESLFDEAGYWRKANQIHNWFVENVQEGVDNCDIYAVSREQLEELSDLCMEVMENSIMIRGVLKNGSHFVNGKMEPILQPGKLIANPEVAEQLLPTQGGFFFGSTDYDEFYMEDIGLTIQILDKVLKETDFATHAIYYTSSW